MMTDVPPPTQARRRRPHIALEGQRRSGTPQRRRQAAETLAKLTKRERSERELAQLMSRNACTPSEEVLSSQPLKACAQTTDS